MTTGLLWPDWFVTQLTLSSGHVCVCVCVCFLACACVCVRERERESQNASGYEPVLFCCLHETQTNGVCVLKRYKCCACVCACVCVSVRACDQERERERQSTWNSRAAMAAFVFARKWVNMVSALIAERNMKNKMNQVLFRKRHFSTTTFSTTTFSTTTFSTTTFGSTIFRVGRCREREKKISKEIVLKLFFKALSFMSPKYSTNPLQCCCCCH